MRVPHILHADDFTFHYSCNMQRDPKTGEMTTARPESGPGLMGWKRLKAAWLVLIGSADAVTWGSRRGFLVERRAKLSLQQQ